MPCLGNEQKQITMHEITIDKALSRAEIYETLLPQIKTIIEGEQDLIANLANITAILAEGLGFFWVGFYRMIDGELVLGPFQGPVACTRITLDRGVCGASATQKETIVVPDVEQFPGHIACSSRSKSEIVVPFIQDGKVKMVLDIDSETLNSFDQTDAKYLEQLAEMVTNLHPNI